MKSDSEKLNDLFNLIVAEVTQQKLEMPVSGSANTPLFNLYVKALDIMGK